MNRPSRYYFSIMHVVHEMMTSRGYTQVRGPSLPASVKACNDEYVTDQFKLRAPEEWNQVWKKGDIEETAEWCFLFFFNQEASNTVYQNIAKEVKQVSDADKLYHCILVSEKELSVKELSEFENIYQKELFTYDMLFTNPLKHVLVPMHIPLSMKESEMYLKESNLTPQELPVLLTTDVIARFLGLKEGQIVRVVRKSSINGLFDSKSVVHRYVMNP